jgi:hypothetical protein
MADKKAELMAELIKPLRVKPGSTVNLGSDFDPGDKAGFVKKEDGAELLETSTALLADYQARLAAQDIYGVLVCLQGLDAAGKDGTIRHVMSGMNLVRHTGGPQMVRPDLRRRGARAHAPRDRSALPGRERGPAAGAAGRQGRT